VKAGWRVVPLGEVVKLNYGKAIAKEVRGPVGPVPVYGANGVMDYCEDTLASGPSIIIGRKGSAGAINVADGPFWASDVSYFTQHDAKTVDFSFLLYFLQQLDLPSLAKGVKPGINRDEVYGLPIPLPPLDEQKRIVAVLYEAFEGLSRARANAEANLADARELFAATLRAEFARSPDDWREVALSEIGKTVTGSTPRTSEAGNLGGDLPFIKPGDFLRDGRLDYGNEGLSEKGAAVSRVLPSGCALMVCIGATIGKAGYSERRIATNQQINALIPSAGISGEFIYLQMIAPDFQREVLRNAGQATLPIINKSKWSALKVRVPKSLAWQNEITDRMRSLRDVISDLEARYSATQSELDTLRQALLQKAFSGELI